MRLEGDDRAGRMPGANVSGDRARPHIGASRAAPSASGSKIAATKERGRVFGILIMPNGQQIRIMREDAFRAALAATRPETGRPA
jgi:hypothetical protein